MRAVAKHAGTAVLSVSDRSGRLLSRKQVPFLDGEPAMDAVKKAADIRTKQTAFGEQIVSVDGVQSEWFHFFVKRKEDGREGMPFIALMNGKRAYIDLRNIALTGSLDGIEIRLTVVSCCSDIPDTVTDEIGGCYSDFSLHELRSVEARLGGIISRAISQELGRAPAYLLQQLLLQTKMQKRRLRDLYVEKMLSSALRRGLMEFSDGVAPWHPEPEDGPETGLSFTFRVSAFPDSCSAPSLVLARAARSYSAAEQGKKERARVKELGQRATQRDRDSIEALQEELYKKQQQLEPLLIANLDRVRSSLDCPAAS